MSQSIQGRIEIRGMPGASFDQPHAISMRGLLTFSMFVTTISPSNDQPPARGANARRNGDRISPLRGGIGGGMPGLGRGGMSPPTDVLICEFPIRSFPVG